MVTSGKNLAEVHKLLTKVVVAIKARDIQTQNYNQLQKVLGHLAIDPFQLVGMQLNWRTEQWVALCMIIDFIAAWRFSFFPVLQFKGFDVTSERGL